VVGDAPVSQLDFAAWQIRLERWHFSCGTIDGDFGMRSRRAVTQFQLNRGLPVTGELDLETRLALGFPGNPFTTYTVTAADMASIQPTPRLWRDKAQATYLGYNDAWEMLGEKFHAMPSFLQRLNPETTAITEGTTLTVPNLQPAAPLPKVDRVVILLSETTLLAYRGSRVVACFPCSIAANRTKRPSGELRVKNKVPNPNYTFDPAVLTAIAEAEGLTRKMILPLGPNNPVGLAWIGLTLPGYGIHGTPEPADISRTGSSGCFRLANWNAQKMLRMVDIGTLVEVVE
jgi:lipoprotein-anchoring transpeptidase ErfK/SrfK